MNDIKHVHVCMYVSIVLCDLHYSVHCISVILCPGFYKLDLLAAIYGCLNYINSLHECTIKWWKHDYAYAVRVPLHATHSRLRQG